MTKAVFFDFDETLQDRTAAFERYMAAFEECFYPELPPEEKAHRRKDMVDTGNGGYVNRVEWYQSLIDKWGWENAPSSVALAEHYDTQFGLYNVIFEGSVPLLKKLRDMKIKTGIITNGPSILQHMKIEQSGLADYCDITVVSGDLPFAKPQPEIFEYSAEKLGVAPKECVYVGDHPINDIEGALSAGMRAVRMNFGWFKNQRLRPDVPVISDIYDVLKYI